MFNYLVMRCGQKLQQAILQVLAMVSLAFVPMPALSAEALSHLQLASVYSGQVDLKDYYVSIKYDGLRVSWDGKVLKTRAGNWLPLPKELMEQLPNFALDAELWLGNGRFSQLQSLLHQPLTHPLYHELRLMVFDAPKISGDFSTRLAFLKANLVQNSFVQLIEQTEIASEHELQQLLLHTEQAGGEGLMLHLKRAHYQAGRVKHVLKVKSYSDAEAVVVAHHPGKGQFSGVLGALLVELPSGKRFKIGTGFSLAERKEPPAIGSVIKFKYQGLTAKGTPRFAVYLETLTQEPIHFD